MISSTQLLVACASLLGGANALVAPQQRALKTVSMASTPVDTPETAESAAAPAAPMTTLEAAVLEATGTEPAAVALAASSGAGRAGSPARARRRTAPAA